MTRLIFESPDYLNNLTTQAERNPKQWTTPEGGVLEIDTEKWHILSENESASITEWFVNEDSYQMTLKSGQTGFVPLSQVFAISMVGQLFPENLIKCLSSIDEIYNQMKDDSPNQPNTPPQDKQDSPNDMPDNPQPNDESEDDGNDFW